MKKLNKEGFNDIHIADIKAYNELIECQKKLHENHSEVTSANERHAAEVYKVVHAKYISLTKGQDCLVKGGRYKFSYVSSSN